jgi:hypothetical protein
VDLLQDSLDNEASQPQWVVAEWTSEQCESVGVSIERVSLLESRKAPAEGDAAMSTVTGLLSALKRVAAAHVNRVEVLVELLQVGDDEAVAALAATLEHAVKVLDTLSLSEPRRGRKTIKALSERVEGVLEGIDEGDLAAQVAVCDEVSLASLCERLCAVEALRGSEDCEAAAAVTCVEAALEKLERCSDPVVGASCALASDVAAKRLRGLSVLSALPRVKLEEVCEAEVDALPVLLQLYCVPEEDCSCSDRSAALLGLLTLIFRRGADTVVCQTLVSALSAFTANGLVEVVDGRWPGRDGVRLAAVGCVVFYADANTCIVAHFAAGLRKWLGRGLRE